MFYTIDIMKGVIVDLDGVLADSMPVHYEAWKIVFSEAANIDVDERTIYLLEGILGFGKEKFDVMITADEVTKGKPDPSSLLSAMEKLKLKKTGSIVGENAPLGVEAANRAGIPCIVVLNNTPLGALDFKPCVSGERILKPTELAFNFLQKWCNE